MKGKSERERKGSSHVLPFRLSFLFFCFRESGRKGEERKESKRRGKEGKEGRKEPSSTVALRGPRRIPIQTLEERKGRGRGAERDGMAKGGKGR